MDTLKILLLDIDGTLVIPDENSRPKFSEVICEEINNYDIVIPMTHRNLAKEKSQIFGDDGSFFALTNIINRLNIVTTTPFVSTLVDVELLLSSQGKTNEAGIGYREYIEEYDEHCISSCANSQNSETPEEYFGIEFLNNNSLIDDGYGSLINYVEETKNIQIYQIIRKLRSTYGEQRMEITMLDDINHCCSNISRLNQIMLLPRNIHLRSQQYNNITHEICPIFDSRHQPNLYAPSFPSSYSDTTQNMLEAKKSPLWHLLNEYASTPSSVSFFIHPARNRTTQNIINDILNEHDPINCNNTRLYYKVTETLSRKILLREINMNPQGSLARRLDFWAYSTGLPRLNFLKLKNDKNLDSIKERTTTNANQHQSIEMSQTSR
ncbi:MAG: hypothetical protein ACE365_07190 [Gammaproteobacteria bacterium]